MCNFSVWLKTDNIYFVCEIVVCQYMITNNENMCTYSANHVTCINNIL